LNTAAGHEAMDVGMIEELLRPGVEDDEDANGAANEAAVASEFDDGLGRGLHQQGVAVTLVGAQEFAELLRHGDNDMEVAGRKHLGLAAVREPVFGSLPANDCATTG
jgi:hypothetical protein